MNARRDLANRMADAAGELLHAFDAEQRATATFEFPDDDERRSWFYTPTDHGGLPLTAMSARQQSLTHRLVATALSRAGYVAVATIMGLENVLDREEGWASSFGRERGRDPMMYFVSVFGSPGDEAWSWRFGGHHVSLHVTIADGEVVSTTPCFLGANPAAAPLLGPHLHRPLAAVEDLGRELVRSLDADQRATTIISPVAPLDLVGVNRPELTEGDTALGPPLIWRGRLEARLEATMSAAHDAASERFGVTDRVLGAVAFSRAPKGISASSLSTDQREVLRALLDTYVGRIADEFADEQAARFAGDAIGALYFAWAGGVEPGEPHYYRIQGGDLFCEYDNTQDAVNHVHSVWRDLRDDFGRDALAEHYAGSHHG